MGWKGERHGMAWHGVSRQSFDNSFVDVLIIQNGCPFHKEESCTMTM